MLLLFQLQRCLAVLLVRLNLHHCRVWLVLLLRGFGRVAKELVAVLEPVQLRKLTGGVVDVLRGRCADLQGVALHLHQVHEVRGLLVFISRSKSDIDRHVKLIAPLTRINRNPRPGNLRNHFLVLVLSHKLQHHSEQGDEPFRKVPRHQIKPHVGAVCDDVHPGRGLVQAS